MMDHTQEDTNEKPNEWIRQVTNYEITLSLKKLV